MSFSQNRDTDSILASFGSTLQRSNMYNQGDLDALALVDRARHWWTNRETYRNERRRARDYDRGRHWDEYVEDPDNPGEMIQEKELIQRQNRQPWVINQLGSIVRNLKGQYRQNTGDTSAFAVENDDAEAVNSINVGLRSVKRENRTDVIEPDGFYEHILSGAHCWRTDIRYAAHLNRDDVNISLVDNTRLFYNLDMKSRRFDDMNMIGQLHDFTSEQLISMFAVDALGNYDERRAREIIEGIGHDRHGHHQYVSTPGFDQYDGVDFYTAIESDQHRIIEIWHTMHDLVTVVEDPVLGKLYEFEGREEDLEITSRQRVSLGYPPLYWTKRLEQKWYVTFVTPYGFVVDHMKTPYWHGSHPYTLGLANLVDGETWGLVYNVIDPQRWLNRLVSMVDFSLASSAKGVLMVPEDSIPPGMEIEDFAEVWSRSNGVLKVKVKPGAEMPQQIAANAIPGGTFEMLGNLQQWMDTTSGVTGPLRGVDPSSGTPAALFQQQITQATVTNLDFFESYFETIRERDLKTIQVMLQAYRNPVVFSDTAVTKGNVVWDPQKVAGVRVDISVANVGDTATYRQLFEGDLKEYLSAGFMNFAQYLQMSSHPKAQVLLKILQNENPEMLQQSALDLNAAAALAGSQLQQQNANV